MRFFEKICDFLLRFAQANALSTEIKIRFHLKESEANMSLDFDVSIESEPEVDPVEDKDTVKNIGEIFRQQFKQVHQESASLKKKYITHAAASSDFSKIAIGVGKKFTHD